MARHIRLRKSKRKKLFNLNLWIHRFNLLYSLVERNMKLLYKRSILGVAWTLIRPILQLLVFSFVFQLVLAVDVPNYSSFVFTGLLVWNWFQTSLFQATGVIISSRPLIRQPNFPNAMLPVVIVTTGLVHFVLAMPVLIIFILIDKIDLSAYLFTLPIIIIVQFIFTLSLSYPLAALNVTFRDTQHTLGVLLQLTFYMSGIFYQVDSVPTGYKSLYYLNPLVHIINEYRHILIDAEPPSLIPLLTIIFVSMIMLPAGYYFFKRESAKFIEEV